MRLFERKKLLGDLGNKFRIQQGFNNWKFLI